MSEGDFVVGTILSTPSSPCMQYAVSAILWTCPIFFYLLKALWFCNSLVGVYLSDRIFFLMQTEFPTSDRLFVIAFLTIED